MHDYRSDRMVAGGYTYEDLACSGVSELKPLDYAAATTGADGAVTLENVSTWADAEMTQPLNRLYGETSANGFSVANGTGLSNKIGALGTYSYITKADAPSRTVFGRSSGGSAVRELLSERGLGGEHDGTYLLSERHYRALMDALSAV